MSSRGEEDLVRERRDKQREGTGNDGFLTGFPSPGPTLQCVELGHIKPIKQIKEGDVKKKKEEAPSVSFWKLFSFADAYDGLLIFWGTVGACVHGVAIPVFFIFFGKLINAFGTYHSNPEKMSAEVSKV